MRTEVFTEPMTQDAKPCQWNVLHSQLEEHMESEHEVTQLSLISTADDSTWKYMTCNQCDARFQNELDVLHHVHEST